MRKLLSYVILGTVLLCGCNNSIQQGKTTKVEIKDNWYLINGEKFFIKAIGYEIGARPGQDPYKDKISDLARMKYDLKFIKDAGFNTIRTWSEISEDQLKVVQESGLKIIFGIWVKPERNYGDTVFQRESAELVKKVVAYSKKYDCVISYLILNEPMTDNIYKSTAKGMVKLLTSLKQILNTEYPGIPVSISGNVAIDEFIDMNLMDYYGYNGYDYGDGQDGTLGYKDFLKWCFDMNGRKKPIVITEFGYSVSGIGYGRYGGNTLEAQRDGVIGAYRQLLDAGATGACPFYYADGWWKGNQDSIHNNTPEEWFGYVGYSDLHDTIGTPRPVWYALSTYIKGLIISPKNQEIYGMKIPVELYLDPSVAKIEVVLKDSILLSRNITKSGYFTDTIIYNPKGTEDAELAFYFFDSNGRFIKSEVIYSIISATPVELPKLTITVDPSEDLNKSKVCKMKINISNIGIFKIGDVLRYNFNPHIVWEPGEQGDISVNDKKEINIEKMFKIPDTCWVLTASAGVTVKYGKVPVRIHDQKLIFRGDWYQGLGRK